MALRKIKILGFTYKNPEGRTRYARRGEEVDLTEEEAARGDASGAFEGAEPVSETKPSSDEELIDFVKNATVSEVVDAATDADYASRLLDAESVATGGEPRVGVVNGLQAVVGAV